MLKSVISEGKTTNEAIEKGLKELKVSKNMVDIKVLENKDKKSFFSILAPRVVKVELTLKESAKVSDKTEKEEVKKEKEIVSFNEQDVKDAEVRIKEFLDNFLNNISDKKFAYELNAKNNIIEISVKGEESGFLIGHRGDVLNSIQTILNSIANRNNNSKIKVLFDVENYRDKRKESLENLAIKVGKTVSKTGKSITLEPMSAYERKIIHSKLQENKYVTTHSIGEEPNRKVVISKK